ncbi:MAG: IreB family regulatory phosphoprotein [Lachnospiraceae bacterium]|nr:IreB family regulatory phosphoprotein [Lachnospiraceae bacterium]
MRNIENTQIIEHINEGEQLNTAEVLKQVYGALTEKGYDPINQIVGYIMSGDPTYITSYKNARSLIMKVERDEILEELMAAYVETRLS